MSRPIDNQTLSPNQELLLAVANSVDTDRLHLGPNEIKVLTAWLQREAYLAAAEAAGLRAQGVRMDVADGVAEDNPGFLLAFTLASLVWGSHSDSETDDPPN